jgi:hypothetical protein
MGPRVAAESVGLGNGIAVDDEDDAAAGNVAAGNGAAAVANSDRLPPLRELIWLVWRVFCSLRKLMFFAQAFILLSMTYDVPALWLGRVFITKGSRFTMNTKHPVARTSLVVLSPN